MNKRGRPPTDDVLTPREWEVLDLLRAGLSNREIAERLGVSLAGAKFHVSEIISKLGVQSREEASDWRPSRHGMLGVSGLAFWRDWPALTLAPKLIGAALVLPLAIGGIGLSAPVFGVDIEPSRLLRSAPAAEPTPHLGICAGRPECSVIEPKRYASLAEVVWQASFEPRFPSLIPAGYQAHAVEYLRMPTNPPNNREVHNDSITVLYRNAAGHNLTISQGFPAWPPVDTSLTRLGDNSGSVKAGEREVRWLRGFWEPRRGLVFPLPPDGRQWPGIDKPGLLLSWEVGRFGEGWALSPDRLSIYSGSPMSYAIMSDTLTLEELIRIAQSVSFD